LDYANEPSSTVEELHVTHSERDEARRSILPRGAILAALIALQCAPGLAADPGPSAADEGAFLTVASAEALLDDARAEVETTRGLKFERPVRLRVVNDDEVREHLIQRLESFQPKEELQALERAYKLLGLLPPDADVLQSFLDALREQAGGFYDPASGSFYLLDDVPEALAQAIIVHELTHALEDQHYDLDARLRAALHDDDRLFALGSVHEGSASLLMLASLSGQLLRGEISPAAMQAFMDSEGAKADVLLAMPPVLQRQLVGPYVLGASFLLEGNFLAVMGGGFPKDNVDRAYAAGPLSSEQILHPEKYWADASRDDPRPVRFDGAGRALGRRWRKSFAGTLGEICIGVMVGAPTPAGFEDLGVYEGRSWTNAAAAGWGGDRWELWVRGDEAAVLLGTVWDSPLDAEEFAAALQTGPTLHWKRSGDRVAVVAGALSGKARDAVLDRILTAEPEASE